MRYILRFKNRDRYPDRWNLLTDLYLKLYKVANIRFLLGEDKNIMLNITVENLGEEAHQAYLMITIPEKVRFDDFVIDDPSTQTMRCHEGN